MMYFGMLAFGIGHVLYITSMAIRFPGYEKNLLWSALGSAAIVGVMFLVCVYAMKMQFGKFLIPSIAYAFCFAGSWCSAQRTSSPHKVRHRQVYCLQARYFSCSRIWCFR